MKRPIAQLTGIFLGVLLATAPAAIANDGVLVNVVEPGKGAYEVKGSFVVPAQASLVWKVLTDYDQLGAFIPSVKSNIVSKPAPDTVMVAQESTTRFMAIPKTMRVLLQLQEAPQSRIDFADVAQNDFEHFKGSWKIEQTPEGTRVEYVASAKPRIYLPVWGGSLMHDMVKGQLTHLKKEILRRPATADETSRRAKPAA